ncbi:MAG: MOSC domain-containing protein, partial [bacterium]|nr:MOSC domain-containing protein [bacterium]
MATSVGILSGIFIASHSDSLVSKRVNEVRVLENGFEGDKHQSWFRKADARARRYLKGTRIWNSRQISIVSEEELALIAEELGVPSIKPEWLGANMCIQGVPDVSLLQPRTKIFIPNEEDSGVEVGIYITAPNKPCVGPGEVIQANYPNTEGLATKFPQAAINRRGVVAVVEHGGLIR